MVSAGSKHVQLFTVSLYFILQIKRNYYKLEKWCHYPIILMEIIYFFVCFPQNARGTRKQMNYF